GVVGGRVRGALRGLCRRHGRGRTARDSRRRIRRARRLDLWARARPSDGGRGGGGPAGAGGDPRMRRARHLSRVVLSTLASALVVASAGAQTPPMPPALVPSAPISAAPVGSGAQVTPPAPRSEAQSLTPPAPRAPEPAIKERPKPRPQPAARPIPPPAANAPAPVPAVEAFPGATTPAAPAATSREADVAHGACQRGYYLTAFIQATKRIEAQGDMRSMTLLGELYANGFGMPQDDKKAAEWYRLAAERGDREAMFALAMFRLVGRAGSANREEAA